MSVGLNNPCPCGSGEPWEPFEAAAPAGLPALFRRALGERELLDADAAPSWQQRTADPAMGPKFQLAWEQL